MAMNEIMIDIDLEEIDINTISNDVFNVETSIIEAKRRLKDIEIQEGNIKELHFEDDTWVLINHLTKNNIFIKFDDIEDIVTFNKELDIEKFKNILKCWVVQFFDDHTASWVRTCFNNLKKSISISNGFHMEFAEKLKTEFSQSGFSDKHIAKTIEVIYNFFDFSQIDSAFHYIDTFSSLYDNLSRHDNIRKIPSSKDVMNFSQKLDKWFLSTKSSLNTAELITYYPLVIWFKLTTIIPMRPSEFCRIARNAVTTTENKHYIKLPRIKQKKSSHNVQIVDEFLISEDIYNLIYDYIELSNQYGHTETLISYRAIIDVMETKRPPQNKDYFTNNSLTKLLKNFYVEILQDGMGLKINFDDGTDVKKDEELQEGHIHYDINRVLRPGDTRHIAFVSLMLQGYDQVEIARLGGHTTLSAQQHYISHMEFWIDSEVQTLSENFENIIQNRINGIYHPEALSVFDRLIDESWIESDIDNKQYEKLDLGYCSDESMPCPTFDDLYTGCYFCKHWRISLDELERNKDIILREVSETFYGLKDSIAILTQLYKENDLNEIGEISPSLRNEIKSASMLINSQVYRVSALRFMFGGIFNGTARTEKNTL
jgi:hypothetical protein